MTLDNLYSLLGTVPGIDGKVAYYAFPEGAAPELPYIVYIETSTDNFMAGNTVYFRRTSVDIELYTETKDPAAEAALEAVLNAAELPWEKSEDFLESESCWMHTYSITI